MLARQITLPAPPKQANPHSSVPVIDFYPPCFDNDTNPSSRNSRVFTSIQIAGGGTGRSSHLGVHASQPMKNAPVTPLSTAFTPNRSLTPLESAFTKNTRGVPLSSDLPRVPNQEFPPSVPSHSSLCPLCLCGKTSQSVLFPMRLPLTLSKRARRIRACPPRRDYSKSCSACKHFAPKCAQPCASPSRSSSPRSAG